MIKLLFGRLLPIGAAIGLLASSASPLRPALNAFAHAANALGGQENEATADAAMPDEAQMDQAIGQMTTGGFSLTKMFKNLFGPSESDKAKAQLAEIIANVKGRSAGGQPGLTPDGQRAAGPSGKAPKTPKAPRSPDGKPGKTPTVPAGGKGATGKAPAPTPAPAVPPVEPGAAPSGS